MKQEGLYWVVAILAAVALSALGQAVCYAAEEQAARPVVDNRAEIEVKVPANAEVWFGSTRTAQRGTMRSFLSPPLDPAKLFTYEVRARWIDATGKMVEKTKQVEIKAGWLATVDFTKAEEKPK